MLFQFISLIQRSMDCIAQLWMRDITIFSEIQINSCVTGKKNPDLFFNIRKQILN